MRKNCSSEQYQNKGTFKIIRKETKMKYLVFSTGKWEWVKGSGWEKPVSVYNRVKVDESKETLTKDDIDTDAMHEQLNNEYFEVEDGTDYYYETTLENEDGETLQKIGMWLSDYRKEIAIDNSPEKITRYMICEMSTEIYSRKKHNNPLNHLYEGVVLQEDDCLDESVKGVYKTEEEARKAFEKYETEIQNVSNGGCGGYRIIEYYLYERSFDLKEAIKNEKEVNSEEDFDKQLKEDCFHFNAYDYSSDPYCDGDVLQISPMNILVDAYDEKNRDNTEKYVLFHNYKDAAEFESEFMDMCEEVIGHYDNSWLTKIYFDNGSGEETISEEEFKDWFNERLSDHRKENSGEESV